MNARAFAWRSLVRQPARTVLGVLGVAAVGALLFDMLLLSSGLVISMRDLLDQAGFDIRVSADQSLFTSGTPIPNASRTAAAIAALSGVDEALPVRFETARADWHDRRFLTVAFLGAGPSRRRPWTLLEGRDLSPQAPGEIVISRSLADLLARRLGDTLLLRPSCGEGTSAMPPVTMRIAGIAVFPFDASWQLTAAANADDFARACGEPGRDEADLLMIASKEGHPPDLVRAAVQRLYPELVVLTNEQAVAKLQQGGFSYFRQISTVLVTVTLGFALLLITVLLTVSVNQRLGVIAALRALGFSQRRVVADVLWESAFIVAMGGGLSLPLGLALAEGLDLILRTMPSIPAGLHFFVFEPRALALHVALHVATAIIAAVYPMRIVARLPIASTLRNETVS